MPTLVGLCPCFGGYPMHWEDPPGLRGRPSKGELGWWQWGGNTEHLPRPLARAREIWVPTFSDKVAVSAPARMDRAFANRRHSCRAAGPKPPVESIPNGEKSQPAAWHTALLWAIFARSTSAAADDRPSGTADEAEQRSVCETVTSTARGRGPTARNNRSAGRSTEPGMACSNSGAEPANWDSPNRRSRRWLWRR